MQARQFTADISITKQQSKHLLRVIRMKMKRKMKYLTFKSDMSSRLKREFMKDQSQNSHSAQRSSRQH